VSEFVEVIEKCEALTNEECCTILEWMVAVGDNEADRRSMLEEEVAVIPQVASTLKTLGIDIKDLRWELYDGFITFPIELGIENYRGFLNALRFGDLSANYDFLLRILEVVYSYWDSRNLCEQGFMKLLDCYDFYLYNEIYDFVIHFWLEFGYTEDTYELKDQIAQFLRFYIIPVFLEQHLNSDIEFSFSKSGLNVIKFDDIYEVVKRVIDRELQNSDRAELKLRELIDEFSNELVSYVV